jgi:hypothetical protein
MFFPPRKVVDSPNMTLMDGGVTVKLLYQSNWDQNKKKRTCETESAGNYIPLLLFKIMREQLF